MTMTDLRDRFAVLDAVVPPDLWPEVTRRAEAPSVPVRVVRVGGRRAGPWPSRTLLVAALAALMAAIGGALLVASWRNQNSVVPDPSQMLIPRDTLVACSDLQRWAATPADGWTVATARPGSAAGVQPGWIAVWGIDEIPEVILIDPATNSTCRVMSFPAYASPPRSNPDGMLRDQLPFRGRLSWSPDGSALAIVVMAHRAAQDLYVLSSAGLAGPLVRAAEGNGLAPSWSHDSTRLAVTEASGHPVPEQDDVWILSEDGSTGRPILLDCDACYAGPVNWSPDDSRIAATLRAHTEPQWRLAVGTPNDDSLAEIRPPVAPGVWNNWDPGSLLGWRDEQSLLFADHGTGRFMALPVDRPWDPADLGGTRLAGAIDYVSLLAPDRSRWASDRTRPVGGPSNLVVTELSTGTSTTVAEGVPEYLFATWAPDSQSLAYIVDPPAVGQGVWIVGIDGSEPRLVASGAFTVGAWDLERPAPAWQPVWPSEP